MSFLGDIVGGILDFGQSIVGSIPVVGDAVNGVIDSVQGSLGLDASRNRQDELTDDARTWQRNMVDYQNKINIDNATMQHNWQVEDWQRNNEYNSPEQQVQRLQAAGLNPLLAETTGGLSSAITGQSAPAAPSVPSSDVGQSASVMSAISQLPLVKQQVEDIKLTNEKKRQDLKFNWQNNVLDVQTKHANLSVIFADKELKEKYAKEAEAHADEMTANLDFIASNAELSRQKIENLKSERNLTDKQVDSLIIDNLYKNASFNLRIQELASIVECNKAEAAKFLADIALTKTNQEIAEKTNEFLRATYFDRVAGERARNQAESVQKDLLRWDAADKQFELNYKIENKEFLQIWDAINGTLSAVGMPIAVGAGISNRGKKVPRAAAKRNRSN